MVTCSFSKLMVTNYNRVDASFYNKLESAVWLKRQTLKELISSMTRESRKKKKSHCYFLSSNKHAPMMN